ncbi:MAG: UDP-N-acetylmuramoyl-L-alanine--D-glutamate ligase [Clostridia bacterium]|nr:UDP-N-acetylmuramoyl-L-alanine--D-glutamate ligase [Clostridia bacterium]
MRDTGEGTSGSGPGVGTGGAAARSSWREAARARFAGRRCAVVGLGLSNRAVAAFLLGAGARVEVFDLKPAAALTGALAGLDGLAGFYGGEGYLDALAERRFDYVFPTPGMRKDLPALAAQRRAGAVFHSEVGLFLDYCPAPVLGVTGSAGKTTTTRLLGDMLAAAGRRTHVGGNLGRPLLAELEAIAPGDVVVLELSSFQLQLLQRSPRVGVLLNIRPNHLDIHASFAEYRAAKERIWRFQGPADTAVLNADDPLVAAGSGEVPGRLRTFSLQGPVPAGAYLDGTTLYLAEPDLSAGAVALGDAAEVPLLGRHNIANVLAAAAAAAAAGVPADVLWRAVRAFRPVEHRLEFVREWRGVAFYNDSIATAPDRTLAALASFERPIVLIAGGYDKKIPFDELGEALCRSVRAVVLLGATAEAIEAAVRRAAPRVGREPVVVRVASLDEAVSAAASLATPGDVVLLSPACASYDLFANFEERGRAFKDLVRALP